MKMSAIIDTLRVLSLLSVGLFAGIMTTLVFVLQKQWDRLGEDTYAYYFRGFLLVAKGNPIVSIITCVSFLIPITLGVAYMLYQSRLHGMLFLSAGLIFFLGCFLVTLKLNFPIYHQVIGWGDKVENTECEYVRSRFFLLNAIRLASAIVAFVLLAIGSLIPGAVLPVP